jgi:FkbM family methyltransferase
VRWALRRWARTGRKSSRLFQVVEKWGPRLATRPLSSRLPNGCHVTCDLADFVQRQIYFRGLWEPVESYLFARLLQPGMTVIDGGANVGQFTLLASTAVGSQGGVHSFEPIPSTFSRLRDHVTLNHLTNVNLVCAALWNEESTVTLGLSEDSRAMGNSGDWSVATVPSPGTGIQAQAIRLDSYVAERGLRRVDFIKLDIQGAEPFAIAGGRRVLESCHPTILMEVYRPGLVKMGSSPAALWAELKGLGYRAWRIGQSFRKSGAVSDLEGVELANFLFHHEDLASSVTSGWLRRAPKQWACSGW